MKLKIIMNALNTILEPIKFAHFKLEMQFSMLFNTFGPCLRENFQMSEMGSKTKGWK